MRQFTRNNSVFSSVCRCALCGYIFCLQLPRFAFDNFVVLLKKINASQYRKYSHYWSYFLITVSNPLAKILLFYIYCCVHTFSFNLISTLNKDPNQSQ